MACQLRGGALRVIIQQHMPENETYGMVTLEAMAAGAPVVGAAAAGTAELVQEGHNGLLFPLRNVAACARALHRCLPATRQRVENARREGGRY